MEVSPQAIATTTFRVVKKGYDPDEVRSYLGELSRAMDTAQSHAQTMEARARQAVAKAERLITATPPGSAPTEPVPTVGTVVGGTPAIESQPLPSGADTISRTLLLAQQTAEELVAKAQQQAAELTASAEAEAKAVRDDAHSTAAQAVDQARSDARVVGDEEKARIEGEIHQLLAKLEFLRGDIEQLEKHSAHHRERLLESAEALRAVAEHPTAGFANVRRPMLSGAADSLKEDFASRDAAAAAEAAQNAEADESTGLDSGNAEPDEWTQDAPIPSLFDDDDAEYSDVTGDDPDAGIDLKPSDDEVPLHADVTAEVVLRQA